MNIADNPHLHKTAVTSSVFCQDNLELLKSQPDESVDLIYCDILYGTGRNFGDYQDLKPIRIEIESHYLPRLIEMKRVLKQNGSIYLQMDTRINHWMRILMDDVFGYKNFQNELVWVYRSAGFSKTKWSEKHDVILLYSKSKEFKFNLEEVRETDIAESTYKRFKKYIDATGKIPNLKKGKMYYVSPYSPPKDWLNINTLPQAHSERNGYATQKPKALIERLIKASSNEGDTVADYYLGSGTTAVVCKELKRNFIGCDINPKAIEITKSRLSDVGL
jgi:DNA modification methylase